MWIVWRWAGLLSDRSEEFHKFIHCHLVVLFLLLHKHVMMFSRDGIGEKDSPFLFPNDWLIISLEVILQLYEDLKASLYSLWGYIIQPYKERCKRPPWQQSIIYQKRIKFYTLLWWIWPCPSRCHLLLVCCCASHKPLSTMLTGWWFCWGQSVCKGALFLCLNT